MPLLPHRTAVAVAVLASTLSILSVAGCLHDDDPMDISTEPRSAKNGLDDLSPGEAVDTVIDTLEAKGSFHVTGTMDEGAAIDMTYVVGEGATGTIGDSADDSTPVEFVSADGRIYVTGDEQFLAQTVGEEAAETIGGKWVLLGDESAAQFDVLADGRRFAEALLSPSGGQARITGVRDVDGSPAVGLLFHDSGTTLWVAAEGDPVPLRLEKKGASGGTGVLRFTDVGADVDLTVPADEDVVDAADLPEE
ncbi:MAG: hypothetical protein ACOC96_06600 [Actinomycetota bacterium]